MLRHLLRPIVRSTRSGARSYHQEIPHELRPPHMDELPVPCGSWQEAYNKAQSRYNLQLAIGVISLIGTIIVGRMNGAFWLNYSAPTPKK